MSTDQTIAMKSGGYYSARTKGAKDVIDNAAPLVMDALAAMNITTERERPFAIADFGAADGGTSLALMGRVVGAVRERAPERPITLTYTDLPSNDFSQVFRNTQGIGGTGDDLKGYDDLFVLASGTSFHRQILPPGSLDFGFSATAMHWCSETAGEITDHVHAVGATGAALQAFTEVGLRDWDTILEHRAAELAPGGHLVLVNFGIDEQGRYLGHTSGTDMFDTFNALWRNLVSDGTISEAEYRRTNFPQFYRNVEQFRAPFDRAEGVARRAGLTLEHLETRVVPCPYKAAFLQDRDAEAFAPALIGTLRSWSEVVFFTGLDPTRPEQERRAIVDRFYRSYEDLVRQNPDDHAMDYVHIYMVVSKG